MTGCSWDAGRHTLRVGTIMVASFLVLVWVGSGSADVYHAALTGPTTPSVGGGVVSGVFVAGAACAALMSWRRHPGPKTGRIVAAGALVAAQSLMVTLFALRAAPPRSGFTVGLLVAAALAGLAVVVAPLFRLRHVGHVVDDGLAVGLGMGLMAAGHLWLQVPVQSPPSPVMQVLVGVLVTTHVTAAALVLREHALSRLMSWLVVTTVLVVAGGLLVHVGGGAGTLGDGVVFLAWAAIGAAWLGAAWVSLRRTLDEDRARIIEFEQVLVSTTREQRERLHELRSTLAGLVTGSKMLDRPGVPDEARERLWASVRRELDRMERLLAGQDDGAADIDLDEALPLILDLQRLKGRHVEFRSNGDVVRARFDALAEVVNILMDNAAKHGGTDTSVVEVVRRDEANVDIRVTDYGSGIAEEQRATIFEWGRRASASPGEGIGLSVAQRLMTEDGGSLRLAEDQTVGSSFVITLPAARRSPEDTTTPGDDCDWRRTG